MFAKSFSTRSLRGDVPVQVPILLFVYTIIFLVVIELVMLFFLQSSLNTAAQQIAILAANNTKFPLTANGPATRCQEAVQSVGGVFPGYSARVRADYIDAVVNNNKTGPLSNFDEIPEEGNLRTRLIQLGARRPDAFWGGSPPGGPGNRSFGGCYALRNPSTNQIVFHTVVHCSGCWPVFLKGFHKFSGDNNSSFTLTGWLEGRGSAPASANGTTDALNLNKSLLSSGPRPLVWCTQDDCEVSGGGNQNQLVAGNGVCRDFNASGSRPNANSTKIGSKASNYAVDEMNKTGSANGVARLLNCGDIDPLILVGARYASMGNDAFGRVLRTGGRNADSASGDFLGQTDNYVLFKPACNSGAVPMDKVVGDITNLNGALGPCIIRQDSEESANTRIVCRTDSAQVEPWLGPYKGGPRTAAQEHASSNSASVFPFNGKSIGSDLSSASILGSTTNLTSPLDNIIPYHAVCDICNPGSPKCGMYGTCRNEGNVWPQTKGNPPEVKSAHLVQIWTNTPFFNVQPQKIQIECRYRRDCNEKHCCLDAMKEGILDGYCSARGILDGNTRTGKKCTIGSEQKVNKWTYKGVPNFQATDHTSQHLYKAGGFPHCSTASVRLWKIHAGECCAPDVESADLPCGDELAPQVQLNLPAMSCAAGMRECGGGNLNSRYCPGKPPEIEGNCLKADENYPIGGENPGGPAGMPGSDLAVAPAMQPPPNSYCSGTDITAKTTQCPGNSWQCKSNNTKVEERDYNTNGSVTSSTRKKVTATTSARSCVFCSPTPLIILFNSEEPTISSQKACFSLNPNYANNSYAWLKGSMNQGFIAYDFNKNGIIDNGTELFGNITKDRFYASGYAALHFTIDENKDGLLNGAELENLLIWFDLNEDGHSQAAELKKATDLGIIELDAGLYLAQRVKKKLFVKDGSAFASSYSAKGYKLKDKKGIIKKGFTWDINLQGSENQKCQSLLKIRQAQIINKKKGS